MASALGYSAYRSRLPKTLKVGDELPSANPNEALGSPIPRPLLCTELLAQGPKERAVSLPPKGLNHFLIC